MEQIVIVGWFEAHPEDTEAIASLMKTMTEATVQEAGCEHYAFSRDLRQANRFQLSEIWESEAALKSHFETPHMASFRAGLANLRVEHRTVKRFRVKEAGNL